MEKIVLIGFVAIIMLMIISVLAYHLNNASVYWSVLVIPVVIAMLVDLEKYE